MGIKIKNTERLLSKLKKIKDIDLKPVIKDCTLLVEGQAKELCPTNTEGTEGLKGSIHPEVKENDKEVIGRIYTQKWYAAYVEFGTGPKGNGTYPYQIKGFSLKYRDTKWCYTKDEGKTFIWTRGQEAQSFMYAALEMNKKRIQNKINNAVKEELLKKCRGGK